MGDFDFNSMFAKAQGKPVYYNGTQIYLADRIPAKYNQKFVVTIESTNSKYIQGVGVAEQVEIFNDTDKRAVVFENISIPPEQRQHQRSKLPFTFEVVCKNKKGFLAFYNMALVDGRQDWFNYACAMIIEELESGKRYYCNDWQPNNDFDDIVFRVEW